MPIYTVTITKQFPAWDEKEGIVYRDIAANTKRDAIKIVRDHARWDGHTGPGMGRCYYSAVKASGIAG